MALARLKNDSARRKKSVWGVRAPRMILMTSLSAECDARVSNVKLRLPPSGLSPQATAMASISVDFPDAFAPARNVTCGSKASFGQLRDRRHGERIRRSVRDLFALDDERAQERLRHAHTVPAPQPAQPATIAAANATR